MRPRHVTNARPCMRDSSSSRVAHKPRARSAVMRDVPRAALHRPCPRSWRRFSGDICFGGKKIVGACLASIAWRAPIPPHSTEPPRVLVGTCSRRRHVFGDLRRSTHRRSPGRRRARVPTTSANSNDARTVDRCHGPRTREQVALMLSRRHASPVALRHTFGNEASE